MKSSRQEAPGMLWRHSIMQQQLYKVTYSAMLLKNKFEDQTKVKPGFVLFLYLGIVYDSMVVIRPYKINV